MGVKTRQVATDSPRAEVGEIDTRAPFASVKAAVSLFGEVAISSDKSATRKPKPQSVEKTFAQETQLHVTHKELYKLKEQLRSAETTRIKALTELDSANKTVEVLTRELSTINTSKKLALKATEAAKSRTKQVDEVSSSEGKGKDDAWKHELANAREQYAVAISELDAAKQELRRIRKDFDASMDAKIYAQQQEAEAKQLSKTNAEKATQLSKDITAAQESLLYVKLAMEQAQQEEFKTNSEKDSRWQSYRQAIEEKKKKLLSLTEEFDPELNKNLERKLAETDAEIGAIQKEMEDARVLELESVTNVTTELGGAKGVLQKVAEEENSLKVLVESLNLEFETVKREHSELKEKDQEVESVVGNLHDQLAKCKAELQAAVTAEAEAVSTADDLTSTLQHLSAESEAAIQEAEVMNKNVEELRHEAEAAREALAEAEEELQAALSDAEEAKAAEARAVNQIKELSEKASGSPSSTSGLGANITISKEEFDSLSRKVEESGKLADIKVEAATAHVEAVRASESELIKRLEATQKEMEDMARETEEAMRRAEMAEGAKKAVEGELMKWREKEQKEATETESQILAERSEPKEQSPSRAKVEAGKTPGKVEVLQRKTSRGSDGKRSLLPILSSIFRRKTQVDGGSPSYLPGEKPV